MKLLLFVFLISFFGLIHAQTSPVLESFISSVEEKKHTEAQALIPEINALAIHKPNKLNYNDWVDFLYYQGLLSLQQDHVLHATQLFDSIRTLENKEFFAYTDPKKKETYYFLSKAEAETYRGNVKDHEIQTDKIETTYGEKTLELISLKVDELQGKAISKYTNKEYTVAAQLFLELNDILNKFKKPDPKMKFNAAVAYQKDGNYEKSAQLFQNLLDEGYEGAYTVYSADNNEGRRVTFSKENFERAKKDTRLYTRFKTETIQLNDEEIYEKLAFSYYKQGKMSEALKISTTGSEKYPQNEELKKYRDALLAELGQEEGASLDLPEMVKKYPEVAINYYNLAMKQFKDPAKKEENKKLLETAIQKNVDEPSAYIALMSLYLEKDEELKKKINENLGGDPVEKKNFSTYTTERKTYYEQIILPLLTKGYAAFPSNEKIKSYLDSTHAFLGK